MEPLDYFGPDGLLQMRGYPKRVPWPKGAKPQAIADQLWEQSLQLCALADPLGYGYTVSMGNHLNSAAIALLALAVIFLAIKEPKCDPPQGQVQQRLQRALRRQLSRARRGNCASFRPKKAPAGPGLRIQAAPCCWRASST